MRAYSSGPPVRHKPPRRAPSNLIRKSRFAKSCPLCKQVGRTDSNHYLSECKHLPEHDRKYIARARQVANIFDDDDEESSADLSCAFVEDDTEPPVSIPSLRIQIRQSPYLDTFYRHHNVRVTIDSGATGNLIRESAAKTLGVRINKSSQSAHQADGSSPLIIKGETSFTVTRDGHQFCFDGLVVEKLDVDILGGTPFMEANDIAIRPAKHQVILNNGTYYPYGAKESSDHHAVRRAHLLRAPPQMTTLWPGEYIEVDLPATIADQDSDFALEPRTDMSIAKTHSPE